MNSEPPPEAESIGSLFMRLIEDAERFVRAEMRLYRAQLFARLGEARLAILLGATAFLLAQSALIAMLVGLVMILRRPFGPVWATIIVVVGALLVAGVLLGVAITKIKNVTDIKAGSE